jgi:hypothetical protein
VLKTIINLSGGFTTGSAYENTGISSSGDVSLMQDVKFISNNKPAKEMTDFIL